jgi:hypothetical protein
MTRPTGPIRILLAVAVALLLLMPQLAAAQEPPAQQPGQQERRDPTPEPRAYDRVITKEARSDEGVFTVHRIGDRLFYEIPKTMLDKEFLWVSQIARTTLGVGWGGQAAGNRVVRWERRGNRIFLRNVAYDVVADSAQPIARAASPTTSSRIVASRSRRRLKPRTTTRS